MSKILDVKAIFEEYMTIPAVVREQEEILEIYENRMQAIFTGASAKTAAAPRKMVTREMVMSFVVKNPGSSVKTIAAGLDASVHSIGLHMGKLSKCQIVYYKATSKTSTRFFYIK